MEETQNLNATPMFAFNDVAKVCHEANKAYCATIGDTSQPDWENAPDWQKESAINGVKFHFYNENTTPADSHNSWLKEKTEQGWKYGEVKDPEKKEHPCFTAYENLPKSQQLKDYIFKNIIEAYKQAFKIGTVIPLTYGQKMVGLSFNPSGNDKVAKAKQLMAEAIDLVEEAHAERTDKGNIMCSRETASFRTNAVMETITAQMAIVKYLTWSK